MIGSRRGRPSLIGRAAGTAARTAVITKTATAVASSSAAKQQARTRQAKLAHAEHMAAVSPAAEPAGEDLRSKLAQLASLHDRGVLSDAEFIENAKSLA
ncbi:MAG: hypothetical protein ACK4Z0_00950 [Sphingomonadaceae bacterium]